MQCRTQNKYNSPSTTRGKFSNCFEYNIRPWIRETLLPSVSSMTWKEVEGHVKILRVTRFTLCTICEADKKAMSEGGMKGAKIAALQADRKAHYNLFAVQRQSYK